MQQPENGNKYLNMELLKIDLDELSKRRVIGKIELIDKMYENKNQLDLVHDLLTSGLTLEEEEWIGIRDKLEESYKFFTQDWVKELEENTNNPAEEFAKIFEALVYQVLKKGVTGEIEYEPEILVGGKRFTPDFIINGRRIVEAKLSDKGAFKNRDKYVRFDVNMIKVYLSSVEHRYDMISGGSCSIATLIKISEVSSRKDFSQEREMMAKMIKHTKSMFEYKNMVIKKDMSDVRIKVSALKAQLKALVTEIDRKHVNKDENNTKTEGENRDGK